MNPYASAQQAYTESSVMTAPPERLVVMLYDGAIRFLTQGAFALRNGNREVFANRLRRAEAIIDELNVTLDMSQGEVAQHLRAIYAFCKRHLIEANVSSDPERLEQVIALLSPLRDAWQQIASGAAPARATATAV
jgi:flagellar protein FliS